MKFIVVDSSNEACFIADYEADIVSLLNEYEWLLEDVTIFEIDDPIQYEVKLVRKESLVRKGK